METSTLTLTLIGLAIPAVAQWKQRTMVRRPAGEAAPQQKRAVAAKGRRGEGALRLWVAGGPRAEEVALG